MDSWNPTQYELFREQRMQPFFDLVALVEPAVGMRVVDLGCGTGELTAMLAGRFEEATVEGVDSSAAMLERAADRATDRVSFRREDISAVGNFGSYDLVFSHAALQWVPDNERLIASMLSSMRPGAQVAVQVPKNENHPSHRIAGELAEDPRFADSLRGYRRYTEALNLERYAELLYEHGFRRQVCFEKIYGHELARSGDVVEWVRGTMLTAYLSRLGDAAGEFVDAYRERLLAEIGDRAPYFYPFRRLLFWGVKEG